VASKVIWISSLDKPSQHSRLHPSTARSAPVQHPPPCRRSRRRLFHGVECRPAGGPSGELSVIYSSEWRQRQRRSDDRAILFAGRLSWPPCHRLVALLLRPLTTVTGRGWRPNTQQSGAVRRLRHLQASHPLFRCDKLHTAEPDSYNYSLHYSVKATYVYSGFRNSHLTSDQCRLHTTHSRTPQD